MTTASSPSPVPIVLLDEDAASLAAAHPPRWVHPSKRLAASVGHGGDPPSGRVVAARWAPRGLPERPAVALGAALDRVAGVPGFFDDDGTAPADEAHWYLNFADPELFAFHAGPLLAQDELQVLEHPLLASVREACCARGIEARTVDARGRATPWTVAGVERRCRVATEPDATAGRPAGLYGNRFARADEDAVRRAVVPLAPPVRTRILAMAAPPGGHGGYGEDEIARILETATSGFAAALDAGRLEASPPARTIVHGGLWGCGAFGGDPVLMLLAQMLAAALVGLDGLVLHGGDERGEAAGHEARRAFADLVRDLGDRPDPGGIAGRVAGLGRVWGESDGN